MLTDIEIAHRSEIKPIIEIAEQFGIKNKYLESYGVYKAKVNLNIREVAEPNAKVVLVTAMTPTPFGEGKTTVSIGINDAINRLGKKSIVTLREPSLGPVFGVKGGATGGGYSQVVPMEDINLHFTGDIHAVGTAHNLLAAMLDNKYSTSDKLCIDPDNLLWHRVLDMNDRALRRIIIGLGEKSGQIRESRFEITAASEVMAILGLSYDIKDLKEKLGNIVVAVDKSGNLLKAGDMNVMDAMTILLKDAIKPNIVQSLEGNIALIHTGPFANIAHGTSSIVALDIAKRLSDIVVIEAGFGSDLGAEKFFNLVSRKYTEAYPDAVVIVATLRALKYHGGISRKEIMKSKDLKAIKKGFENLKKHIENIKSFNRPVFVALNLFEGDTKEEINLVVDLAKDIGTEVYPISVWSNGGKGALNIGEAIIDGVYNANNKEKTFTYGLSDSIEEKIEKIAVNIYGASSVIIPRKIKKKIENILSWGYKDLPICMAKTQSSLSDDSKKRGRPEGFNIEIKDIKLSAGAGFLVVYTGDILTMPGLPKIPAAENMHISNNGTISGLF